MKICGKCKEEKPLSDFADNAAKKDGKQYQCRSCQSKYRREHYEKNRARYIKMSVDRSREKRDKIWKVKTTSICSDCENNDPRVLQFDHTENNKEFNIGEAVSLGMSWEKISSEIDKCDVVCANCHIVRTYERGGWREGE